MYLHKRNTGVSHKFTIEMPPTRDMPTSIRTIPPRFANNRTSVSNFNFSIVRVWRQWRLSRRCIAGGFHVVKHNYAAPVKAQSRLSTEYRRAFVSLVRDACVGTPRLSSRCARGEVSPEFKDSLVGGRETYVRTYVSHRRATRKLTTSRTG